MPEREIQLRLNGSEVSLAADPARPLVEFLHDDLGLGSVREGCGVGMCGACTVLVDGQAVSSCLLLLGQVDGKEVQTVEGLAEAGRLHPIQRAFIEQGAFQCAYCTPGFILSTLALLHEHPHPDDTAIRAYLAGNLCRCGSYANILRAVRGLG